jgi:hypothetical protein
VQTGTDAYRFRVIGGSPGAIRSSSGVRLIPDAIIGSGIQEKIDTLLAAGAPNAAEISD